MTWVGALAIYFVLWWLVLFAVLPWGASSPHELGREVEAGHAPSAPLHPHLKAKFAITTAVSAAIFGAAWLAVQQGWISLDSVPFLPEFWGR